MHELVNQLPTLLGVIVGAAGSYLASAAGERARWRRTQGTRWDDKRADAYAAYGRAIKQMINLSQRLAAGRGIGGSGEPLAATQDNLEALAAAEAVRGNVWETVLLLGDPSTIAAARHWQEQVWRLEWFARGLMTGEEAGWDRAMEAANEARAAFYGSARRDLRVAGDHLPTKTTPFDARELP
jgi:hypothetical protein